MYRNTFDRCFEFIVLTVFLIIIKLLTAAFSATPSYVPPLPVETPKLSGSFIQPYLADSFDDTKWQKEFSFMKRAGIGQLFIQWTADSKNKTAVYPSSLSGYKQSTKNDIVKAALSNADIAGIEVYLGLQVNEDWWTPKSGDENWLKNEAAVSIEVFDDLFNRYGAHKSLKGWYLSFEVDNWRFAAKKDWHKIALFYSTVLSHIKSSDFQKPVVTAPFFNPSGGQSASEWQAMWTYLLLNCPIDIVALQDGIGAGHTTKSDLPEWFNATREAIKASKSSAKLWDDAENFNAGQKTMPIKELVEDMKVAEPYVSSFICFTYNHYTSPQQVNPFYHATYKLYVDTGIVENIPPSAPGRLTAVPSGTAAVNLYWNESADNLGTVGYRIYRNNSLIGTAYDGATSFTDSRILPGILYSYKVAAFDAAGNCSEFSNSVSLK